MVADTLTDEPGDLLRLHLERLALEAAKYENSTLKSDKLVRWTWSVAICEL